MGIGLLSFFKLDSHSFTKILLKNHLFTYIYYIFGSPKIDYLNFYHLQRIVHAGLNPKDNPVDNGGIFNFPTIYCHKRNSFVRKYGFYKFMLDKTGHCPYTIRG